MDHQEAFVLTFLSFPSIFTNMSNVPLKNKIKKSSKRAGLNILYFLVYKGQRMANFASFP